MPKISKSCYTSQCCANYIKNHLQVNAMQNKDQRVIAFTSVTLIAANKAKL